MEHVEVWIDDAGVGDVPVRVGELFLSRQRGHEVVRFRYHASWIAPRGSRYAIDPELPLGEGDYFPGTGVLLHGALRDTAPDRWGRRLMERRERDEADAARRPARRLTEWDYLIGVQDAGPPSARCDSGIRWLIAGWDDRLPGIPPVARLRELQAAAVRLDADPDAPLDAALLGPHATGQ
jgi:serine/threonine-protein kinase HipA